MRVVYASPMRSMAMLDAVMRGREEGMRFLGEAPLGEEKKKAGLETLILSGACRGPYELDLWRGRIDTTVLRRLETYCGVSVASLETLTALAGKGELPALRRLGLRIVSGEAADVGVSLDEPTARLLRALPALEALTLTGRWEERVFDAVLGRHGPTLRLLRLVRVALLERRGDLDVDAVRARAICQRCPRLEDLKLRVRRRQGGPEEVAVYRMLGRLRHLRRVTLVLDGRVPKQSPITGDEVDRIRKMLVNLAVDETLARAIYREITTAADLRLEYLRLETEMDGMMAERHEMRDWATWIGRSWVLDRNDMRGEVAAREVPSGVYVRGNLVRVNLQGRDVWTETWPARGGDWRDDWHSFPLSGHEG